MLGETPLMLMLVVIREKGDVGRHKINGHATTLETVYDITLILY